MALLVSNPRVSLSPLLSQNENQKLLSHVSVKMKNTIVASYNDGGKKVAQNALEKLEPLWDDGYGTQTMKDYTKMAMDLSDLTRNDGGPPRWFCPIACGMPLKDSPVLMYLPGLEGTGTGLVVHEKALGKLKFDLNLGAFSNFDKSDFVKMAMVNTGGPHHLPSLGQMVSNLREDIPLLSAMTTIIPRDTLDWRIKLLESAAGYANSRLHTITAEVLILASGKDNLLPSKNEAQRLSRLLPRCNVRVFEENGHTILMENGVNVLSAIRATQMYRHSSKFDIFRDFFPPSMTEFKSLPMETWWYRLYMGAVMFSTMENGNIVRGLGGIPNEGPVLIVGNHLLWGFDVFSIVLEFLREKKVMIHGLAHPEIFEFDEEKDHFMIAYADILKKFGAIPVSGRNFYKLMARNSYTLLYPGGVREALHRKVSYFSSIKV
ncbi:hypothetical protein L2E82_48017 [Cichorium intybus]|uniref:Uncharacterized protein n=1 Tax=Cichorium intybus TaxID=13427 RepID=A0ACB8YXM1_CICIN|nr:hypothetical protein L2E82_48017 [Cichorium intybus]